MYKPIFFVYFYCSGECYLFVICAMTNKYIEFEPYWKKRHYKSICFYFHKLCINTFRCINVLLEKCTKFNIKIKINLLLRVEKYKKL